MSLTTSIAIYFVLWWLMLFFTLPFGIRSQEESGAVVRGTDPGAPIIPAVLRKLFWTTALTSIVFVVFDLIYSFHLISIEDMATLWGLLK